jgi:hypothetical protein
VNRRPCNWLRLSPDWPQDTTISGLADSMIARGDVAVGRVARVTLQRGEYFVSYGCAPWKPVQGVGTPNAQKPPRRAGWRARSGAGRGVRCGHARVVTVRGRRARQVRAVPERIPNPYPRFNPTVRWEHLIFELGD